MPHGPFGVPPKRGKAKDTSRCAYVRCMLVQKRVMYSLAPTNARAGPAHTKAGPFPPRRSEARITREARRRKSALVLFSWWRPPPTDKSPFGGGFVGAASYHQHVKANDHPHT